MSLPESARPHLRSSTVLLSAILALGAGVVTTSAVLAQPAAGVSSPSSYLMTTGAKTPLRCGAGQTWYVVAELPAGTLMKVAGETDGFFEVEYPAGLAAVVKITEGELNTDRGVVVLTRRTPLMAFNALDPAMENCYKRVFAERPLEPGTELKHLGSVESRKGELAGYRVQLPAGARGYVLPSGVRPATPEEIAAVIGTPAAVVASTPAPSTSTESASTPPVTTMEGSPEASTSIGPAVDETIVVVMEAPKKPTNPNDALIDDLNRLEPSYQRVMRSDMERGEFIDLLEAYNAIAENATIDSTGEKVRTFADAKIALLQIRAELQAARLELAAVEVGSVEAQADLARLARLAAEARGYAVVGRLLTSAIYDGSDLPRMFRVQSLERGTSRTIAYVIPNDGLALDSLTGKIVGVRGDSTAEATPRIPVLRASEVDILTLEPAQSANAPEMQ